MIIREVVRTAGPTIKGVPAFPHLWYTAPLAVI